jgi:hypothetical protein
MLLLIQVHQRKGVLHEQLKTHYPTAKLDFVGGQQCGGGERKCFLSVRAIERLRYLLMSIFMRA